MFVNGHRKAWFKEWLMCVWRGQCMFQVEQQHNACGYFISTTQFFAVFCVLYFFAAVVVIYIEINGKKLLANKF